MTSYKYAGSFFANQLLKVGFLLLIISIPKLASTQTADPIMNNFNSWFGIKIQKKINKKIQLYVTPELRLDRNKVKKYFGEAGIKYSLTKAIDLTGGYRFTRDSKKKGGEKSLQRFFTDLNISQDIGRFGPKLRLRYTHDKDLEDLDIGETMRLKIGSDYNIKKSDFAPFLSYEIFRSLNDKEVSKFRFGTGVSYKISKKQKVKLGYNLDYPLGKKDNNHIALIRYSFKF